MTRSIPSHLVPAIMLPALVSLGLVSLALAGLPVIAAAQQGGTITGFAPSELARERAWEARAAALAEPGDAARQARALAREPHVSGTPAQARVRDLIEAAFRSYGLAPEVRTYTIYMPHPTSVRLWRVAPRGRELPLAEGPVAEDTTSWKYPQLLTFNGYGAAGDVTGDVVYVNYGMVQDYRTLDSLGISVKGKIAIARYGRSFRGIKAREAERHGAIGLIIYSDPADDGYDRGDLYPDGPMRPWQGVQRGSVFNDDGDPTTPGYASVPGAKRIPLARTSLPRIPVIPASYRNAAALLQDIHGGPALPSGWQGGLPFRYHVGPGTVRARIAVTTDAATHPYKEIWDVLATIPGTEEPDQLVIMGAHSDAWSPGADDNVSGTVGMLQTARTLGALLREGWRPKRTIVLASWDAEEWGLMGSTEFVEQDSARLARDAAAYFNFDMIASGSRLEGSGSPSLRPFFRDVTKVVRSPDGPGSVYDQWRRTAHVTADTAEPAMGDPGGGSDFAGFYNHLGIPIAEWGYGGRQGIYHSAYDSYHWVEKFGDPGYRHHAVVGELGSVALLRMADADILPHDYAAYAGAMRVLSATAARNIAGAGWRDVSLAGLDSAIGRMQAAGSAFNAARDAALARGAGRASWKQANTLLLQVERAFVRPTGLVGREWFRNVIYAADNDNGYANMGLPTINEAVRARDRSRTVHEIADLTVRFDNATRILTEAAQSLR